MSIRRIWKCLKMLSRIKTRWNCFRNHRRTTLQIQSRRNWFWQLGLSWNDDFWKLRNLANCNEARLSLKIVAAKICGLQQGTTDFETTSIQQTAFWSWSSWLFSWSSWLILESGNSFHLMIIIETTVMMTMIIMTMDSAEISGWSQRGIAH